jgi:hypothetical protein
MPNGVRARGNSRHANRQRNAQRDTAVRAQLVQEAPPIVVEAEPISVQADPDTIVQLRRRIAELEEQVKKVKQNYKSAKKAEKELDNIVTNTSLFFKQTCEAIGMEQDDMLTYQWLNNFKKAITTLKQKSDHYDTWQKSIAEHSELGGVCLEDIVERLVSTRKQKDCLRKSCDKWKSKYRMACEGTLLAFQETEIRDLQDENDKLLKLNKSLLNIKKKDKGEIESLLKINADMAEDFCKLLDKFGGKNDINIHGINTTTAEVIKKYVEANSNDRECRVSDIEQRYKIEGTGRWRNIIDTKHEIQFKLNTRTRKVYDIDDWEAGDRSDPLGELMGVNGKLKIMWLSESDSDSE